MGNNKWGKWKEYFVGDEIKKEKKSVDSPMEMSRGNDLVYRVDYSS